MNGRRRWPLIAIGAVYLYAFPYFAALRHANELPRILTTEQLVERGTFRLDERLPDLGSLADISTTPDGHRYQNKAPGPSIAGVAVYYPLSLVYRLAGHSPPPMLVAWLLRVLLAVLPTLVFLRFFPAVAARFATTEEARSGALAAYALGSMALPLGVLFLSHAIASALVGIAFAVAVAAVRERASEETRAAAIVGALLGLAMLCEYQAIFAAGLVAGYVVWGAERRARAAVTMAAACVPFIAALAVYHWTAFGSPWRTGYAYSVDPDNRIGVMGIVGFSKVSMAQLFVRVDNGLLLLSPWVLLALVGAVDIARSAEARARAGREAFVATLVAGVYFVFVAALTPQFGRAGWSVGPRYLAVAMPFLAWLAAAGLDACLRNAALRVLAFASIWIGVFVHVLAATTYPHWPIDFQNPLFEVSIRLLREGYAPHSVGTLVGLRGFASLAPLYLGVIVLVAALLAPARRHISEVIIALAVAVLIVSQYERLASTPPQTAAGIWQFVTNTYEPRP